MSSSAQSPAGSVLPSFVVHFAAPVSAISTVVTVMLPQLPQTAFSVRHEQACNRVDLRVQDQSGLTVIPFRYGQASSLPRPECRTRPPQAPLLPRRCAPPELR